MAMTYSRITFQISPPLFCKESYDKYFPSIISHSHFFSALKKQLLTEVSLQVKHCQERQPAAACHGWDGTGASKQSSGLDTTLSNCSL